MDIIRMKYRWLYSLLIIIYVVYVGFVEFGSEWELRLL